MVADHFRRDFTYQQAEQWVIASLSSVIPVRSRYS
jgi:hypothetical protein